MSGAHIWLSAALRFRSRRAWSKIGNAHTEPLPNLGTAHSSRSRGVGACICGEPSFIASVSRYMNSFFRMHVDRSLKWNNCNDPRCRPSFMRRLSILQMLWTPLILSILTLRT